MCFSHGDGTTPNTASRLQKLIFFECEDLLRFGRWLGRNRFAPAAAFLHFSVHLDSETVYPWLDAHIGGGEGRGGECLQLFVVLPARGGFDPSRQVQGKARLRVGAVYGEPHDARTGNNSF